MVIYSLVQEFEITLEILIADRTLANLQFYVGIIVHVIDAHFVGYTEAAECDILSVLRVVMARGNQRIALKQCIVGTRNYANRYY